MSLADELLADFEDDDHVVEEPETEAQMFKLAEVEEVTMETEQSNKSSVRNIAKLRDSEEVSYSS